MASALAGFHSPKTGDAPARGKTCVAANTHAANIVAARICTIFPFMFRLGLPSQH